MAHMPFGWGRRACIGMRLALVEAKMALVSIYRQYKLVEGPDTQKVNLLVVLYYINSQFSLAIKDKCGSLNDTCQWCSCTHQIKIVLVTMYIIFISIQKPHCIS